MFPKKGKFFPDRRRRPGTEIRFEKVISEALREELRGTGRTAKTLMEWTGASERTVKNWLAAKYAPRGPHLICILRHSEKMLAAMLLLAGKEERIAATDILEARNQIADCVRCLDILLGREL